jgi:hypothetical protein
MSTKISLVGLDKAEVLAALYNASKPQGMGFMHYDPTPMTKEQAAGLLARTTYFDYLMGRVMKIDLSSDELDPWGYDRDNGPDASKKAISALTTSGNVNPSEIQETHTKSTADSAEETKSHLGDKSSIKEGKGVVEYNLGLDDVADVLGPKVDKTYKENLK